MKTNLFESKNEMAIARQKSPTLSEKNLIEEALRYKKLIVYYLNDIECLWIDNGTNYLIAADSDEFNFISLVNKRIKNYIESIRNMSYSKKNDNPYELFLSGNLKDKLENLIEKQQNSIENFKEYFYDLCDEIDSFNFDTIDNSPAIMGDLLQGYKCTSYKNGSITKEDDYRLFEVDRCSRIISTYFLRKINRSDLWLVNIDRELNIEYIEFPLTDFWKRTPDGGEKEVSDLLKEYRSSDTDVSEINNIGRYKATLFTQKLNINNYDKAYLHLKCVVYEDQKDAVFFSLYVNEYAKE